MKLYLYIGILLFFLGPGHAVAQQASQSSLYFFNKYKYNSAYAGFDRYLSITGSYRTQWLGIARNPVTQSINAHMPMYALNGSVGISIENDLLGATTQLSSSISYNYVHDSYLGLWSAGVRVGVNQISLDGTLLETPDGIYEDGVINHNDPILPNGKAKGLAPFTSIGGYFIHDLFEVGLSIENIIASKVDLGGLGTEWNVDPTLNIYGEFFVSFSGVIKFHPSLFLKTDFKETQLDLSIQAIYDDYLFGGIAWRGYSSNTFDAIILFAGMQLNENWKLGYAYDIPVSALSVISRGSHEVVLNFNLNKSIGLGLPPKTIYNPRF